MIRPRLALRLLMALVPLAALASCSSTSFDSGSSSDKSITIAQVDGFDDDVAVTALWKHLLEAKGYTVTIQSLDLAAAFTGMSRGDIDAYLDAWLPSTHGQYVNKYKSDLTVLDPYYTNDRLVLAVPDFVPAKTISDVASDPGTYGNQIVGIEPGSGEMEVLRKTVMPAYGMSQVDLVEGSTPAMLAELKSAVRDHKPVVAALWTPHWAFAQMKIRVLEDDKHAWPAPDGSQIVLSNDYAKDHTQVTDWFRNTKLTDDQLSSLMADIHAAGSADQGVKTWLKDNSEVVGDWTNAGATDTISNK